MHTDVLKKIFIQYKEEILQEWKESVQVSKNSPEYFQHKHINKDLIFNFLFDYFITDQIQTEPEHHQLENMIRKNLIVFPGCISEQFNNRLLAENIFIQYAKKYHPTELSLDEMCWIQEFFKKFLHIFIILTEQAKDNMNQIQIQKLKDQNTKNVQLLEKISTTFVHEFRNPLTVVLGFLQLLKKDHPDMPYMNIISLELEQLNDRISQFLALSKKDAVSPVYETINPKTLCTDLLEFLQRDIHTNHIKVTTEFESNNQLHIDPSKLRQVLLNIFLNALDALKEVNEKNNRQIIFTYKSVNNQHIFSIQNNGPRIPVYIESDIFQPFVSTKELGSGIGLYISHKIIQYFHGEIHFTSNEQWTTFSVHLPIESFS